LPETRVVAGILPAQKSPQQVAREFRRLVACGLEIRPAGAARSRPSRLLAAGYVPKHEIRLFDATFYLAKLREDQNFRYFVAYVIPEAEGPAAFPRIFYKDSSLVWRSATHYIRTDTENWIGKGDVKVVLEDGDELLCSAEETTNLPFEIQAALDLASRSSGRVVRDERAVPLVLRKAPEHRIEPYEDFAAPRRRARSDPRQRIHGGRPIAWFTREKDPASLRFAPGFEPDFAGGVVEESRSRSNLYGGEIRKFRILSRNQEIQYQFIAAPELVWIIPPQALSSEITSYGVRTIDVAADEDLFVPGYEYHYVDTSETPPQLHSQIPVGFAGAASDIDPSRADASRWLERLPVIAEFRRALRIRRALECFPAGPGGRR
jgi:hypothetical protein